MFDQLEVLQENGTYEEVRQEPWMKAIPSMVSVGIQWNSFALISSLFSQEKMFFPENGSPGNLSLPLLKNLILCGLL